MLGVKFFLFHRMILIVDKHLATVVCCAVHEDGALLV